MQLDRCQSLLDSGEVVYVHGLGAAVSRAVNVALAVKTNNCGSVDLDVRTATVNLVDDIDYVVSGMMKPLSASTLSINWYT